MILKTPPKGTMGLGLDAVKGCNRSPWPPAKMNVCACANSRESLHLIDSSSRNRRAGPLYRLAPAGPKQPACCLEPAALNQAVTKNIEMTLRGDGPDVRRLVPRQWLKSASS